MIRISEYLTHIDRLHKGWAILNKVSDSSDSSHAYGLLRELAALLHLRNDIWGVSGVIPDLAVEAGLSDVENERIKKWLQLPAGGEADSTLTLSKLIPVFWKLINTELKCLRRYVRKRDLLRLNIRRFVVTIICVAVGTAVYCAGSWLVRSLSNSGCMVYYYKGVEFEEMIGHRMETKIQKGYAHNKPFKGAPRQNWSARWSGYLAVPDDAEYKFYAQSDDGVRIYIDDDILIDNWTDQDWGASGQHAKKELNRGLHKFQIDYYFKSGTAAIKLKWAGGSIPPNTVVGVPHLRKL